MKFRPLTIIFAALMGLAALSSQALAQQKTVKACEDEWKANKAENQAKGITEKSYVTQCRAGSVAAQPAAPATPAAKPAPSTTAAPPAVNRAPTAPVTSTTQANQFSTEALAKARCPSDTIVWVNLSSRIYHYGGNKDYGKTKRGAYMCEQDAAAAKYRAAKNEKHPS